MARRRYQSPRPRLVGKRWEILFREDVVNAEGKIRRVQRRAILGYIQTIPTERMARRVADPILARINARVGQARRVMKFSEFVERWKISILPEMKPSTRPSVCSVIKVHLLPSFGNRWLHEFSTEMLQTFIATKREACSDKTVWNVVMTLRSIWNTAVAWGYAHGGIFEGLRLRLTETTESRCFSEDEVRAIISNAAEPMKTFYWLAAETGMRAGELCGLRWQDVDAARGYVNVNQSSWRGKITVPKTRNGRRGFCISAPLARALAERHQTNGHSPFVFYTRNGTPMDANLIVKRKLQPLLARLGFERAGLHAFRHFNATQMDRLRLPSGLIRNRMGHGNLAVTNRYTHTVSSDEITAVANISKSIATHCYTEAT